MKIEYTGTATRNIAATKSYIEDNLKSKQAALKLVMTLLRSISLLEDNPLMGTPLGGKFDIDTDIRFLVVAQQIVFYRAAGDKVSILRIIDGRSDYMSILFD